MRLTALVLLPLLAPALAPPAASAPPPPRGAAGEDEAGTADDAAALALAALTNTELEEAWDGLPPDVRRDAVELFRQELSWTESFQLELLRFVLASSDVDASAWPAAEPTPIFDPAVHAPAQVITRHFLEPDSRRAIEERARLLARVPPRFLQSAWVYDWSSGEIRRARDDRDPELIFVNALYGFPPEADYAEALLQRQLDDGSQRVALGAFGHAYTDRDGRAYPGVTLYDAWASGESLEMPDVDTLGIVHVVLDDWKTWVAPVSGSQHDRLYGRIGELFAAAHHHRGLREALARTYLIGTPVLRDAYQDSLPALHAIWEDASSTPATLRERLPSPDDWSDWLERWAKAARKGKTEELAAERRGSLDAGSKLVRWRMVRALDAQGALAAPPLPASAPRVAPELERGSEAEAALLERVRKLGARPRAELLERCEEAALASGAPQVERVAAWTADVDVRRLREPDEPEALDARKRRKELDERNDDWKALNAMLRPEGAAQLRTRTVDYDFAGGGLVDVAPEGREARDDTWRLANLLDGVLPGQDLAEARLVAALDEGRPLRAEAELFAHLYADAEGRVYPGITLRDVWWNHTPLAVPAPELVAFAKDVERTAGLRAPLSAAEERIWIPRMAEGARRLRRHELAARTLAATWFQARPELSPGYRAGVDELHALIALDGEDAAALRRRIEESAAELLAATRASLDAAGEAAAEEAAERAAKNFAAPEGTEEEAAAALRREASRAAANEARDAVRRAGAARRDELWAGRARIRTAVIEVLREAGLVE